MRLSNGVAKLENGVAFIGRKIKNGAKAVAFTAKCKREDIKLAVLAQQVADTGRRLDTLGRLDRAEIEMRAQEIRAVAEAAEVRKQEARLRRDIARRITSGELTLVVNGLGNGEFTCSPQPSSPSSVSGS